MKSEPWKLRPAKNRNSCWIFLPPLVQKSGIDAGGWDFSAPTTEQLQILRQQAPVANDLLVSYLAKRDEYKFLKKSIHDLEITSGHAADWSRPRRHPF